MALLPATNATAVHGPAGRHSRPDAPPLTNGSPIIPTLQLRDGFSCKVNGCVGFLSRSAKHLRQHLNTEHQLLAGDATGMLQHVRI